MSDSAILNDLGITNPEQIDRYSLQTINNIDVLRVVYKRQKGSLLPDSKKFRFERREKPRQTEGGDSWMDYEVAPVVQKVMAALDPIVKKKNDKNRKMQQLNEEIARLEEDHMHRLAYIKSLVKEIQEKG